MLEAMKKEIFLRKNEWGITPMKSVYFGGGTPSILDADELSDLMLHIRQNWNISPQAEISLEANPDDIHPENLEKWKKAGFNRLSIGIQSFRNSDLQLLNRAHHAEQAITCVHLAKKFGFNSISIDLIYGIPGLREEDWLRNLQTALQLDVEHVSAYCLTVENRTALHRMVEKKQVPPVDEDLAATHFQIMSDCLKKAGYVHYEISNFGKENCFSQHNTAYWKSSPYIGIGPSAHSYSGTQRSWNIANNKKYIDALNEEKGWYETEELDLKTRYNEYIMIALRTIWGIDTRYIRKEFGEEAYALFGRQLKKWGHEKLIIQKGETLILSDQGRLMADRIASDLFWIS